MTKVEFPDVFENYNKGTPKDDRVRAEPDSEMESDPVLGSIFESESDSGA